MRHPIPTIFLATSLILLVGCPARWKVSFINGAGQPLRVITSGGRHGSPSVFTIQTGHSHTELFDSIGSFVVFDGQGTRLFERSQIRIEEIPGKYPWLSVLLTATNAYPIPPEYRKTWREHVDEITTTKGGPNQGVQ
jgi:hypothetical protein